MLWVSDRFELRPVGIDVDAELRLSADASILVELFGQPGAGKTTLVRAAASHAKTKAGLTAAWMRLPALKKVHLFGQAALDGACMTAATRLAIGARLNRGDSLFRLIRLVIKSHWVRAQKEPLLLEEGHLQDLWSIFYSAGRTEPDPRLLAPLIRCLYRGVEAQIALLDTDPQSAFDRIRGRPHGKSRLDRLSDAELQARLAATAQLPHRIVDAARLAGVKVQTLDASQPIEANAGRLVAMVQQLEKFDAGRG